MAGEADVSGMGSIPSIKGTTLAYAHADLNRLLAEGRLTREAAEVRLRAEDLALLDEKLTPTSWYPIASYGRIVELLADVERPGDTEAHLLSRGANAAEKLTNSGIYQQLEASSAQLGPRVGKIVITVASLIYNFGRWEFEVGERSGEFRITVHECRDLPEVSRFTTQGFIESVSCKVAGFPTRLTSHRPRPDHVIFEATPDR